MRSKKLPPKILRTRTQEFLIFLMKYLNKIFFKVKLAEFTEYHYYRL